MASVSYNARERRLVFESLCWPEDAPGLAEAITDVAARSTALTVDLTRVVLLPPEVATAIGDACRRAESAGCRMQVWAPTHAPTAARIAEAQASTSSSVGCSSTERESVSVKAP